MKLHYKKIGSGKPFVILHGLFGSSDNWQTIAKKIAEYYTVFSVDMRNHGHSPWSNQFSINDMTNDVKKLFLDLNINEVILIGHSMGGKVAMTFAQKYPEMLKKMIVVDIGIKKYPPHHQHILKAINAIDLNIIKTREEAKKHFLNFIESEDTIQFLLKNLYWKDNKLTWRMNISVIEQNIHNILNEIEQKECNVQTLFIRGDKSNYILENDFLDIETTFIDSQIITIPNSGHWIHAEQPEAFINAVLGFCLR